MRRNSCLFLALVACVWTLVSPAHGESVGKSVPRTKRSLTERILPDPDGCLRQCWIKGKTASQAATQANADKMAEYVLLIIANNTDMSRLNNSQTLNVSLDKLSVENMGTLFRELCSIARETDRCIESCPISQGSRIVAAMHFDTNLFCEAQKNWNNFSECDNALNCINHTSSQSTCDQKCGPEISPRDLMQFDMKGPDFDLRYEQSIANQTDNFCETVSCHLDCNKPAIVERCDIKAYGLYLRMKKNEMKSLLIVLAELENADAEVSECLRFSQF